MSEPTPAQYALNLWLAGAIQQLEQMGVAYPGILERGIAAVVAPPEPKEARAQFLASLRAAQSPEELNQLLAERVRSIGQKQALREFSALGASGSRGGRT